MGNCESSIVSSQSSVGSEMLDARSSQPVAQSNDRMIEPACRQVRQPLYQSINCSPKLLRTSQMLNANRQMLYQSMNCSQKPLRTTQCANALIRQPAFPINKLLPPIYSQQAKDQRLKTKSYSPLTTDYSRLTTHDYPSTHSLIHSFAYPSKSSRAIILCFRA